MIPTRTTAATVGGLGAAALVGGLLFNPLAAQAGPLAAPDNGHTIAAAAASKVPVVVARMSDKAIHLSTGSTMRAGRVIFRAVSRDGNGHGLQLLRLHQGYSLHQAFSDIGAAFHGDVKAVRRLDDNVSFRGGAPVKPDKAGKFGVTLTSGRYVAVDTRGQAYTWLRVRGSTAGRQQIPHSGQITMFSYGFGSSPQVLPASGWVRVTNRSDQPHFVVLQRVKNSTTRAMVRKAFNSGGHGKPSFILRAGTDTGVISPYKGENFKYQVPAGKYLMACFWPDDDTGMPHAFMGMYKLVRLR